MKCSSCGTEVVKGYVRFKCPGCLENEFIRCKSCRMINTKYACPKCDFKGP